jgi:hypothetical protein
MDAVKRVEAGFAVELPQFTGHLDLLEQGHRLQ